LEDCQKLDKAKMSTSSKPNKTLIGGIGLAVVGVVAVVGVGIYVFINWRKKKVSVDGKI